jgi:hypothetical protein
VSEESKKGGPHLSRRAMDRALADTLFKPLMPAWKTLIQFCFFEYRDYRTRLIQQSSSPTIWQELIRDIFPFLYLINIVPINKVTYSQNIDLPDYGLAPATYTNTVREPQPFYARLFSKNEITGHLEERKIIEEIYAHLTATILMSATVGDVYFTEIEREIESLCKTKRFIEAKEKIFILHIHSLSIPKFFADRLQDIVRASRKIS